MTDPKSQGLNLKTTDKPQTVKIVRKANLQGAMRPKKSKEQQPRSIEAVANPEAKKI